MIATPPATDNDYRVKLRGLMLFRVLFAFIMAGSAIVYHLGKTPHRVTAPVVIIVGLSILILLLSVLYIFLYRYFAEKPWFALAQLGMDITIVSFIILVTGNATSMFPFMYLIVIIYASMLVGAKESFLIASVCFGQYALLIGLEYYGNLEALGLVSEMESIGARRALMKIAVIGMACYLISFLSGFLAGKEKRAREEVKALSDHVRRIQRTVATGEMAAGLAHEIKNPLASLTGAIQMLKEEAEISSKNEKLMQIVLREADRLTTLVGDFLLFARPVSGTPEPVRIDKAINETVALIEKDSRCRGKIRFEKTVVENIWIKMDPGHLRQILWNLLLNAIEAIDGDGVVNTDMRLVKPDTVLVDIIDNGRGMTEETMQSMFDPFFTTRPNGTGLGLSIVNRILGEYDSRLDIESELGKGSKFTLRLQQVAAPPDIDPHS